MTIGRGFPKIPFYLLHLLFQEEMEGSKQQLGAAMLAKIMRKEQMEFEKKKNWVNLYHTGEIKSTVIKTNNSL